MNEINSTVSLNVQRRIGFVKGSRPGPTLVFFGGIHGNEPAGIKALQRVFTKLGELDVGGKGQFYGLAGNLQALGEGKRFIDSDLNRMWEETRLKEVAGKPLEDCTAEEIEMRELSVHINEILSRHPPPFYFIDLHTTSSRTLPFITINDALINRRFAHCFPVPVVLGLEEYLSGPLLSLLNEKGYLALGFESGQHQEESAVVLAEAFIWMVLAHSGFLSASMVPNWDEYVRDLQKAACGDRSFYEITYRHGLNPGDPFSMHEGYASFQKLRKGTALARYKGETIYLKKDRRLFMPLYQDLGEDGFFLIRRIAPWILQISELLRKLRVDTLLTMLPGVQRHPSSPAKLVADLKWLPYMSKAFFHLMGYRHRYLDDQKVVLSNRERTSRKDEYKKCTWYSVRHLRLRRRDH